ncbi:MAG TPA: PP2C family protein-serine/threonine phosphatase [Vicinamibacterales bacterium]|nr:PP2C family protein-serine/threonine phosphatase [Vicinamibacterales bacterium]
MARKHHHPGRARRFIDTYTSGLTGEELRRVFTRDAPQAYRYFSRGMDEKAIAALPVHKQLALRARLFFWAFTLKLSPARRAIYGAGLLLALLGFLQLFRGIGFLSLPLPFSPGGGDLQVGVPAPDFADGALTLFIAFLLINLLVLLEVADRLSLKNDLEVARGIQSAMLPQATYSDPCLEAFGLTRPANTVGGDFYDVLPRPDGRLVVALGDVAGKGSPAALLMALLLAIFRTLLDEGLEGADLARRLNAQVCRHAPPSRFITLFMAACDPCTGRLVYVNAGHMPALVRRNSGEIERLTEGDVALGMFEHSTYSAHETWLQTGESVVLYSDGVTEAENHQGRPFEESGLIKVVQAYSAAGPRDVAHAVLRLVEEHAQETSLADDVTLLVLKRRKA